MAKDPTGFTPAAITAQAALDAVRQTEEKERVLKEKLLNQSRAVRFLTQDEVLLAIRKKIQEFRDEALRTMQTHKPGIDGDTPDLLMRDYQNFQKIVDLFDGLETQGRAAGKELKAQEG